MTEQMPEARTGSLARHGLGSEPATAGSEPAGLAVARGWAGRGRGSGPAGRRAA